VIDRLRQCATLAAVGLTVGLGIAGPVGAADQIRVNTTTLGGQRSPAVAADDEGGFVVVWSSLWGSPGSATLTHIFGRRLSPSGGTVGGEFEVDEDAACAGWWGRPTNCGRGWPSVATVAPSGEFVVAWQALVAARRFPPGVVQFRRFAPDGAPLGPETTVTVVDDDLNFKSGLPTVAASSDGSFVVAWAQFQYGRRWLRFGQLDEPLDGPGGSSGPAYDRPARWVQGRRYDAAGAPLGPEFAISTTRTGWESAPALVVDSGGNFVVAWHGWVSPGSDVSSTSVQARRYDSDGAPQGLNFQVNEGTAGPQFRSVVGTDSAGNFVVVWDSWAPDGNTPEPVPVPSIRARRFDAAGTPLGPELPISEPAPGRQGHPALAVRPNGEFVVAWNRNGNVQARRFNADGSPQSPELQVNSSGRALAARPAIALAPNGDFLVAWAGYEEAGASDEVEDIYARLVTGDWLMVDGFESGDASRWSGAVQ